jgi:membrane protease YdiL (CAAX protease family)
MGEVYKAGDPALYFITGRNLLAPIMAHGTFDTVGAVLLFLGKYPR